MLGLRMPELLLILAVVVLLFGGKKIPELGAAIGGGIRSFKRAAAGNGVLGDDDAPKKTEDKKLES